VSGEKIFIENFNKQINFFFNVDVSKSFVWKMKAKQQNKTRVSAFEDLAAL